MSKVLTPNQFDIKYREFVDFITNNLSRGDLEYIVSKDTVYIANLFRMYLDDKNKIFSFIYFDRQ